MMVVYLVTTVIGACLASKHNRIFRKIRSDCPQVRKPELVPGKVKGTPSKSTIKRIHYGLRFSWYSIRHYRLCDYPLSSVQQP